ncbi:hypothetical protein GQ54DRAFT_324461 [Martensiomyces pterosporus]|nr:hypothetical protein GQ54DRAFT_324461 [Martensiomyces pterosporus]
MPSAPERVYVPAIPAEKPVFYFTLAANLLNIPVILYSLYYRSFLPIKAKHVWLTSGIGLSITLYNIAYNITDGMMGYEGALSHCRLWSGWIMMTFGLGLAVSLYNMRLILYYRVFVTRQTFSYTHFTLRKFLKRFWPLFALWSPALVTSVVICIIPPRFSTFPIVDNDVPACDFNNAYSYWTVAYLAVQFVFSWLLYFRMRRIAKAFNEFRMALWLLLIFTIPFVINGVILFVDNAAYPRDRIILALVNTLITNLYYWLIILPPVFGHMFSRKWTLMNFLADMEEDGLVAEEARLLNAHKELYGFEGSDESYTLDAMGNLKAPTSTVDESGNGHAPTRNFLNITINRDSVFSQNTRGIIPL